jgi:hypothetical protein
VEEDWFHDSVSKAAVQGEFQYMTDLKLAEEEKEEEEKDDKKDKKRKVDLFEDDDYFITEEEKQTYLDESVFEYFSKLVGGLMVNDEHTDVIFEVGRSEKKRFKAHRFLIKFQSESLFELIAKSKIVEDGLHVVQIEDIRPPIFESLLEVTPNILPYFR